MAYYNIEKYNENFKQKLFIFEKYKIIKIIKKHANITIISIILDFENH